MKNIDKILEELKEETQQFLIVFNMQCEKIKDIEKILKDLKLFFKFKMFCLENKNYEKLIAWTDDIDNKEWCIYIEFWTKENDETRSFSHRRKLLDSEPHEIVNFSRYIAPFMENIIERMKNSKTIQTDKIKTKE